MATPCPLLGENESQGKALRAALEYITTVEQDRDKYMQLAIDMASGEPAKSVREIKSEVENASAAFAPATPAPDSIEERRKILLESWKVVR